MKTFNFFTYLPKRYVEVDDNVASIRNLVYNFKSGDKTASIYVANMVARYLWQWYSHKCSEYIIVCCPASSEGQYKHRFSYFSAVVANRCHQKNAMKYINIIGKRTALHRISNHIVSDTDSYAINIDKEYFKNKKVIIFDDLITSGKTSDNFAKLLEDAGATIIGGMFIAQTIKGIHSNSKLGKFAQHSFNYIKKSEKPSRYSDDIHSIISETKELSTNK